MTIRRTRCSSRNTEDAAVVFRPTVLYCTATSEYVELPPQYSRILQLTRRTINSVERGSGQRNPCQQRPAVPQNVNHGIESVYIPLTIYMYIYIYAERSYQVGGHFSFWCGGVLVSMNCSRSPRIMTRVPRRCRTKHYYNYYYYNDYISIP